jgi:hypothetical protein
VQTRSGTKRCFDISILVRLGLGQPKRRLHIGSRFSRFRTSAVGSPPAVIDHRPQKAKVRVSTVRKHRSSPRSRPRAVTHSIPGTMDLPRPTETPLADHVCTRRPTCLGMTEIDSANSGQIALEGGAQARGPVSAGPCRQDARSASPLAGRPARRVRGRVDQANRTIFRLLPGLVR